MGGMQLPFRLRTLLHLPLPHRSAVSLSSSWSTLSTAMSLVLVVIHHSLWTHWATVPVLVLPLALSSLRG